jgi:hypothetical protein
MPLPKGPKPKDWLQRAAQTKPKKPIDETGLEVSRAKWNSLKEEFLELTITGKDVHWPTLATKYGFKPTTVRHKASTQKWYAEIEVRRKQREDILEEKLTQRTTLALDKLNQDFATDESAIRKRHATMARQLQVKAYTRLKDLDVKDLTPRDALFMLQMGINEERLALGMSQLYEGPKIGDNGSKEFTPVVEQIGGHQRVQKIGTLLLKALQASDVSEMMGDDEDDAGLTDTKVVTDVKPKDNK